MVTPVPTRRLYIVLCAMLASLGTSASRAAEWSMEPSVDLRGEYNDNISFTSAPHPTVWGLILSPDVKFSGATEALNVTGGIRFNINRYFGEEGLDTNDHFLSLHSSYKGERDVVGLNIDSVRDSTLASELAETGLVLSRQQRNLFTVNPSWTRSLTETTAITASYTFSDVRYDDTEGTGLVDYRDHTASVGLQSKFGERDVGSVTAYYERYESAPSVADTYSIQAGYDHAFSETLHGTLIAGARTTRGTVVAHALVCDAPIVFGMCSGNLIPLSSTSSETSTGYILIATLDKKWETAEITGQVSHDFTPSGLGTLVQTDRLGVTWNQQWAPTVSSSVAAAAYQTGSTGSLFSSGKSRYYTIEPSLSWRMTEAWTLRAGYHYSRVEYQNSPAQATQNIAYVLLSYAWPKLSVSR